MVFGTTIRDTTFISHESCLVDVLCYVMPSFEDFNQKLADHLHLVESFHFLTLLTLGQC